jgi:hypothetical protein
MQVLVYVNCQVVSVGLPDKKYTLFGWHLCFKFDNVTTCQN